MNKNEEKSHGVNVPPADFRSSGGQMNVPTGEGLGSIQCDKSVFKEIAGRTAVKVEGVAGIGEATGLGNFLPFKDKDAGIDIVTSGETNDVNVSLTVAVYFGYNIYEVCTELQRRIKDAIETITNYAVKSVNVKVQSLKTREQEGESDEPAQIADSSKQ
jgi:uncharacterized alkaline shock family protein YloU